MFVNTLSSDIRWLSDWIDGEAHLTECRHSAQFCIVEIAPFGSVAKGGRGRSGKDDQEEEAAVSTAEARDRHDRATSLLRHQEATLQLDRSPYARSNLQLIADQLYDTIGMVRGGARGRPHACQHD